MIAEESRTIIALIVNLFKLPKKVKEILEASLRQDDDF